MTEEFSLATGKQTLWRAFLRKGRLEADDKQLGEVVTELRKFLMPPTIAAATAEPFKKRWPTEPMELKASRKLKS